MTEMVILLPTMIAMWFGIDYFRSGYARRLQALNQSQTAAWKLAYSNDGSCFANKELWAGFTGENDTVSASTVGSKGSASQSFQNSGSMSSSMFMYAHANTKAQLTTNKAQFDGGSTGTVRGGTYIACNEVVPGGGQYGDQNVLTPLFDFVKGLFSP
jgi:hypothetical protein